MLCYAMLCYTAKYYAILQYTMLYYYTLPVRLDAEAHVRHGGAPGQVPPPGEGRRQRDEGDEMYYSTTHCDIQ